MNRPDRKFRKRFAVLVTGGVLVAALFPMAGSVLAAAGPGTQLVFTTQPVGGATTPATLATIKVTVRDALNVDVTTGTDATTGVTLTLLAPTGAGGPGVLTGCTSAVSASAGVATFTGCIVTNSGVGYRLRATATLNSGVVTADSAAFTINSGTATKLVFSTQPGGGTTGAAWATQPVVQIQDVNGNIDVADNSTVVTLAIGANPGAGTLTCTGGLSKTVTTGVATFAGCTIDKVGTGYTLVATSSPVRTSTTSSPFNTALGTATKLGFTSQPGASTINVPFTIQPVVAIQDAGGNTMATAAVTTVTLGLGANPGAGTLTCTGGLTRTTSSGVATFSGCSINNAGVGYTLVASATGYTSATSTAFTVSGTAASITITTSAPQPAGAKDPVITWGQGFNLGIQFAASGSGKTVALQGTRDGITWTTITSLTMGSSGGTSYHYTPVTNLWYRAVFAGTSDLAAATSNQVRTVVREIAIMRPTNFGHVRTISRNTSVTFTSTVRPARPELAPAKVSFWFYRQSGGSWVLAAKRDVLIDSAGLARTSFTFTSSGQWYVRSAANPTPYNANSVQSPVERYSVL
jgi:trimeric autotransporter adhesin